MSSLRWIVTLPLVLLCLLSVALAQQAPNSALQIPLFETPSNQTFRHNLCERAYRVQALHDLALSRALENLTISPAISLSEFVNVDVEYDAVGNVIDIKLNQDYPGLVPKLIDEVCERAGCTWRDSFAAINYSDVGREKTFHDLLLWSLDTYDFTADWWMKSVERLRAGATFTQQWYDGTIIMVSAKQGDEDEFDLWGWLQPFDTRVWMMVLLTIFASSFIYYILQLLDPHHRTLDEELHDPLHHIWLFASAFAAQFEFEPKTGPQRIMTFSIAFWALLIISAYTANLASFLVIKNTGGLAIDTLDEAVSRNIKMCIWEGTQAHDSIKRKFKAYSESDYLVLTSQRGVFDGLKNGECEIGITEISSWERYQRDPEINGDCSLRTLGQPFEAIPASFAVKSDTGYLCTSLLRDVFNLHLHNMESEGIIERLWEEQLASVNTVDCSVIPSKDRRLQSVDHRSVLGIKAGESDRGDRSLKGAVSKSSSAETVGVSAGSSSEDRKLNLTNMGGVFVLHTILTVISLVVALIIWLLEKFGPRKYSVETGATSPPESSERFQCGKSISKTAVTKHKAVLDEVHSDLQAKLDSIEEKLVVSEGKLNAKLDSIERRLMVRGLKSQPFISYPLE